MKKLLLFSVVCFAMVTGCKRSEGQGGSASITGKVFVIDMDKKFEDTISTYYSGKEDVYIVYGEDDVYGDRTETHHDGTFQFDYLQPGDYEVYAYSKDTEGTNQLIPVIQKITISKKGEEVSVPDLIIVQ